MVEDWSAIVLAGGVGSRLMPLTRYIPKPMVPVCNKPMIDYNLEILRSAGIKEVVIVVKYLGEEIRKYVKSSIFKEKFPDFKVTIPDIDPLDTADAVRKAAHLITSPNFIVSMADIVTSLPMKQFMDFHIKKGAMASITLAMMPEPRSFGVIMLNDENRILLFVEKPSPQELEFATQVFSKKETIFLYSNLVNTGIYAFKLSVLDILQQMDDLMDFGKHVLPYLAKTHGIFGFVANYYWMDAGNPKTYLYTCWDVLRRWAWPYEASGWCENGCVWWSNKKPIFPAESKLEVPVAIGSNISFGEGTIIGPLSSIGDNSRIGKKCLINKSILWENAVVGDNVRMEESIICNNVEIAAGSVLAAGTVIGSNTKIKIPFKTNKDQIIKEDTIIDK